MAYAQSKDQLCYVLVESTFGQIPNTAGVATIGNNNACLVTELKLDAAQPTIDRPDKTGSLDYVIGQPGRRSGKWNARMSCAGNGAAGNPPDMGPFLSGLFNAAPTVVASTSVAYATADTTPQLSLSIYSFRKPGTVSQQVSLGSIVDSATWTIGQDVFDVALSGTSVWVLDSDEYNSLTSGSPGLGGLKAHSAGGNFPTEPTAPVTNGNFAQGFVGSISLNGNVYQTIRTATINMKMNRTVPQDEFNNFYGNTTDAERRKITGSINLYDDDSVNLTALKLAAKSKTPIALSFQIGATPGNIWTFTLPNVLLDPVTYDDSRPRYTANFDWNAYSTGILTRDAIGLTLT